MCAIPRGLTTDEKPRRILFHISVPVLFLGKDRSIRIGVIRFPQKFIIVNSQIAHMISRDILAEVIVKPRGNPQKNTKNEYHHHEAELLQHL